MNKVMWAKQKGFTIVELLIVIVVIGILAAITMVAYGSMQQRARDSKRMSDLQAIVKAGQLWGTSTDKNFSQINAGGASGTAVGWFDGRYTSPQSTKEAFVATGYLSNGVQDPINRAVGGSQASAYMIAPCDDSDVKSRVILAKLEVAPAQTVAQQVGRTCSSPYYTDYVNNYQMNFAKLIQL
jgi:prepilin-type N-terminal cleavage/methylation domain-containing protein